VTARTLDDAVRWVDQGTDLCAHALDALVDAGQDTFAQPSALPGWSRAKVVAHLDGNARALLNLVTWARTGIETPMYASTQQRDADIEAGAALDATQLRERFQASSTALADAMSQLPQSAWGSTVRTAQGRLVPATEIPWLRAREVMVHAVDLDLGPAFSDLPADFLAALTDDVVARRSAMPDHPALTLDIVGGTRHVDGVGPATTITCTLAEAAAYLTGRAPGQGPALPAWL
jgi:maleylpyruvate isomerase